MIASLIAILAASAADAPGWLPPGDFGAADVTRAARD